MNGKAHHRLVKLEAQAEAQAGSDGPGYDLHRLSVPELRVLRDLAEQQEAGEPFTAEEEAAIERLAKKAGPGLIRRQDEEEEA